MARATRSTVRSGEAQLATQAEIDAAVSTRRTRRNNGGGGGTAAGTGAAAGNNATRGRTGARSRGRAGARRGRGGRRGRGRRRADDAPADGAAQDPAPAQVEQNAQQSGEKPTQQNPSDEAAAPGSVPREDVTVGAGPTAPTVEKTDTPAPGANAAKGHEIPGPASQSVPEGKSDDATSPVAGQGDAQTKSGNSQAEGANAATKGSKGKGKEPQGTKRGPSPTQDTEDPNKKARTKSPETYAPPGSPPSPPRDPCHIFQENFVRFRLQARIDQESFDPPIALGNHLEDTAVYRAIASVAEAINEQTARAGTGPLFSLLDPNAVQMLDIPGSAVVNTIARPGLEVLFPRYGRSANGYDHTSLFVVQRREHEFGLLHFDSARTDDGGHRSRVQQHAAAARSTLRRLGWASQNSLIRIDLPRPDVDVAVRQNTDWTCGIHVILHAWAYALGLTLPTPAFGTFNGMRQANFAAHATRVVELAVRGHMDAETIWAFLACYGFIDPARTETFEQRRFERTVPFLDDNALPERVARMRLEAGLAATPGLDVPLDVMIATVTAMEGEPLNLGEWTFVELRDNYQQIVDFQARMAAEAAEEEGGQARPADRTTADVGTAPSDTSDRDLELAIEQSLAAQSEMAQQVAPTTGNDGAHSTTSEAPSASTPRPPAAAPPVVGSPSLAMPTGQSATSGPGPNQQSPAPAASTPQPPVTGSTTGAASQQLRPRPSAAPSNPAGAAASAAQARYDHWFRSRQQAHAGRPEFEHNGSRETSSEAPGGEEESHDGESSAAAESEADLPSSFREGSSSVHEDAESEAGGGNGNGNVDDDYDSLFGEE